MTLDIILGSVGPIAGGLIFNFFGGSRKGLYIISI